MSDEFLERLGKHLIDSSKKPNNPILISEARKWYKRFTGGSGTPMSDEEVVELYMLLHEEVDN